MLQTSGGSEHSEEKMKCSFCLNLVGVLYPSELELPAKYKRLVQVSPIFSTFTESFLELLRLSWYSVVT